MAVPPVPPQEDMMPLEDLEKLLLQYSEGMPMGPPAGGGVPGMGPPPEAMAETLPADPMADPMAEAELYAEPYAESGAPLDMVSPDLITIATTALVEAGFLDVASSEMTPELVQVLQQVADQIAPGIYNMSVDSDLMEFVNGIANGTIPVPNAKSLTGGGAEPGGAPAGEPPVGGIPGEPAGGIPGPIPGPAPGGPGY